MDTLNVEMSVNHLVSFLFIQNVDNKPITINADGLENTRDLFYFCLDLLFKGLILLYGTDNKVCVDKLTLEQFNVVKSKLKCANIDCHLDINPIDTPNTQLANLWTQNFLNIHKAYTNPENMKLEDYSFDLQTLEFIYKIWFEIKYNF